MSKFNLLSYIDNLNRVAQWKSDTSKDIKFDNKYAWGGYVDNISPNLLPDWASTGIINAVPYGTYLEKMMGSSAFGVHQGVDVKDMVGLRLATFFDNFGRRNLVKVVKLGGENRIYILTDTNGDLKFTGNELQWADITPPQGIGRNDNYNFGEWRNQLYFVNGGEFEFGTNRGGVMRYDPTLEPKWAVIDTGFGTSNLPNSTGADGGTPFYPNTIAFKDDRMYLGGNERFPQQIKFSEQSNPYNVVGNLSSPFLALLDVPPAASDLLRPSTFLLDQNGDQITALLNANGYLWIATNRRFYAYSENIFKPGLPAGLLWLDTLEEHKARTGAYSQKGIIQKDQFFDFISTNTAKPAISSINPIISQDRIDNVFTTRSTYIEDTMEKIQWNDVALGTLGFGESGTLSFYSGAKCENDTNNITLLSKQVDNMPMFSKVPYINAVDWLASDYETFWLSSDTGQMYILTPDNYNLVEENKESKNYPFVWQSGKVGVAKNDTDFSQKKLMYIYLVCCSELDIELKLNLATNRKVNEEYQIDINGDKKSIHNNDLCCFLENVDLDPKLFCTEITECSCSDDLSPLFIHKNSFLWHTLIQVEDRQIMYNSLQTRLTANSAGYFAIHQFGLIYQKIDPIDSNLLSQPKQYENNNTC